MKTRPDRSPSGQALLEFVLVLTLLVVLVLVIIDAGRITYSYSVLQNATREGARYGVVNSANFGAIKKHTEDFALGLDQDELFVSVSIPAEDPDTVQVAATYNFHTATVILEWLMGSDSVTLNSVSRMRIEE